ncbi:hypothetical protein J6590_085342 [Homalodisca vitripennis]|nr:hypothetical protein J6590_085342 [Homalodisca vitripennis]
MVPQHISVSKFEILYTFNEWMRFHERRPRGTIDWPARSPDLSLCDFSLWEDCENQCKEVQVCSTCLSKVVAQTGRQSADIRTYYPLTFPLQNRQAPSMDREKSMPANFSFLDL